MTTLTYAVADSATMLRRNLKHALRYPSLTVIVAGMPIVFLLLFVYVFGGTLGAGLGGPSGGRTEYANYLTPGLLVLAIAAAAQGTVISIAMDMTEGIISRFRTMSISRAAVLAGATPEADALALEVPSDGSVRALKEVLARLDEAAVEAADVTVVRPDLDDVFLALTGHPTDEKVTTP